MAKVKGLAFRSVLHAHASLQGEASLERVYGSLDPQLSHALRFLVASSWYPIEHYAALWDAIQRVTGGNPDYPRLVGRRCIEQDLKFVHKLALAALTVATGIDIAVRLFKSYYDTGRASSTRIDERAVRVVFEGCHGFSGAMWTELLGALETFAAQASKRPARSAFYQGGHSGDSCTIDVSW
jgi:hypothetical protein